MNDTPGTDAVRKKQILNLVILAGCVILGFAVLIYAASSDNTSKDLPQAPATDFVDPLSHVDAESVVLERTQKQLSESALQSERMQKQIDFLIRKSEEKSSSPADDPEKQADVPEKQSGEIAVPTEKPDQAIPAMQASGKFPENYIPPSASMNVKDMPLADLPAGQGFREDILSFPEEKARNQEPLRNPDTYVPAGTFAEAVMIGGADASAAVNAQSNPSPMLFRITGDGTLPDHRKSHLKNCMLTAAVVGDISSERGFIRLENLSCILPDGEIVDQAVEGTIFGPEGKNGVRGKPVWREGALLKRAFAAGALSGLSDGISQGYVTSSVSAEGNVSAIQPGKVFQSGMGKGIGKAMDRLADYNIQRAEQYHPVIQLGAGVVVDAVFLRGFFLDGRKHEKEDESPGNDIAAIPSQGMAFSPSPSPAGNDETQAQEPEKK